MGLKKTIYQKKKERMERDPLFALSEKAAKAAWKANQRAKELGIPGRITTIDVERVFNFFALECPCCGNQYSKENPQSLEHVFPLTKEFGYNDPSNLIAMCLTCNIAKKNKTPGEFWLAQGFDTEDFLRLTNFMLEQNYRELDRTYKQENK